MRVMVLHRAGRQVELDRELRRQILGMQVVSDHLGRHAVEVAEVVEFLCSERNTYTTGSVWSVKGGSG